MTGTNVSVLTASKGFSVGDVIDRRYELRRDLGRGGAGVVFEACHKFTGRSVALKIVLPESQRATIGELRARLMREAQVLASIRHPGVVDILDGGVAEDGSPYIVMERLEGRTLEGLLAARSKLSVADTVGLALQLCSALGAAHKVGVVHRDVKPSNILVVRDAYGYERLKLVDFGIAQNRQAAHDKLTGIGALIGTPSYMSPEQLLAFDDIDERTDIYSLGTTMYECLSGSVPYPGSYHKVLLPAASPDAVPNLRTVVPDVPEALAAVLDRALAKSRAERFPNVREFARALSAAVPGATPRTGLLGPPPVPKSSSATAPSSTAQVSPIQRRRAPRAAYVTPVRLVMEDGVLDGRTEDISEGGLLVLSLASCAPDQRVTLRFALPIEGKVVSVEAQVRWVRAAAAQGMRAIGLELVDAPADVKSSIARYVDLMADPKQT